MTLRQRKPRAGDETGFALVETLLSAVILIAVALATLAAVDRTQKTALETSARSVAVSLAEQDQEKMRALPATTLSNYHPTPRPVTSGSSRYLVTSRVEWVRDASGATQSCTNDSTQADYLRVTSTVTSDVVGNSTKPVTMSSLVAAPLGTFGPSQGTLAVQVKDGRNQPVPNLPVSITGPTSMSDTTNAAGCAIFAYIKVGTYHVLLNQSGWVDPSGTTGVDQTKSVTAGNVSLLPLQYDRAGKITVNYQTLVSGNPSPSRGWSATAAHTGIPGTGRISMIGNSRAAMAAVDRSQPTVDVPSLFPFDTSYNVFSGECAPANPVAAIPDANFFTATGTGASSALTLAAGDTSRTVTVRQPPLKLTVKNGAATMGLNQAHIVLTPTDATCTVKPVLTTDGSGRATKPLFDFGSPIGPIDYDPGVPFGAYSLCIDGVAGSPSTRRRYTAPLNVNNAGGTSSLTVDLAAQTANSTPCPE